MDAVLRRTQDVKLRFKCKYKVRILDAVLRRTQDGMGGISIVIFCPILIIN